MLGSAALERARRTAKGLPEPVVRLSVATVTVHRPFSTPVVDHVGALAERLGVTPVELDALADTRLLARRATSARIANYRYQWLRRTTGARLLEAPRARLASIQRAVLDGLLAPIPVHPAAHGVRRGSIRHHRRRRARRRGRRDHPGPRALLFVDHGRADLGCTAGFRVPRARRTPARRADHTRVAGVGAEIDAPRHGFLPRFPPAAAAAAPHLPQGAPSSPQLANLVAYSLDRRIDAYSRAAGIRYTRYADDLTLSGGPELARRWHPLLNAVENIVVQEGFRLNPAKIRIRQRDQRQLVTGIVVNDHPNLARPEFDRLKAILHDCRHHGPTAANRQHHNDFRAHLLGRISWVAAVNPARGARLRATFDAISWEQ